MKQKFCLVQREDGRFDYYIRRGDSGYVYEGWFEDYDSAITNLNGYTRFGWDEIFIKGEMVKAETWIDGSETKDEFIDKIQDVSVNATGSLGKLFAGSVDIKVLLPLPA